MKKTLVTGAAGQLGRCIQNLAPQFPECEFDFLSKSDLDIENNTALREHLENNSYDYCINTAGYTNVEKAEEESDRAFNLNALSAQALSNLCYKHDIVLIHPSTDYVFDGNSNEPYTEKASTNPLSVYGKSKLKGEENIEISGCNYFIIRTSWLYSEHKNNFLKTVNHYAKQGKDMTITTDQTGSPTNANDLAEAILHIISSDSRRFGLYHFSNKGQATWFYFAQRILEYSNQIGAIKLAKTEHYRTFAARPKYSVLNTTLFEDTFKFEIKGWEQSLKLLLNKSNSKK
jgi:dTDP-4-dehydrorhamnose reductase